MRKNKGSIQSKFLLLLLTGTILTAILAGGAGILNATKVVEKESKKIMNLMCSEKAMELDKILGSIEQSVEMISAYAVNRLESTERLAEDSEYEQIYTGDLEKLFLNVADSTDGAVAFYVRYNMDFMDPTAGFFWSKDSHSGEFGPVPTTDLSKYDAADTEYVGWYYAPVNAGQAVWLAPYYNKNIDIYMISYVVPIYKGDTLVGVVGMDVNFSVLVNAIKSISIYNSGYAFLTDERGTILYHQNLENGTGISEEDTELVNIQKVLQQDSSREDLYVYTYQGTEKKLAFCKMKNDMRLVLAAPSGEIEKEKHDLILQIVIATGFVIVLLAIVGIIFTRRMIRPLKTLTEAAEKISSGDLDITLERTTRDEIGELTTSFQKTAKHLKEYISYINGLAYKDSLTGVKNKTAYHEQIEVLKTQIREGNAEFGLGVFDLNGLKQINDNFGHEQGDKLILEESKIISNVFKHSPVYRIGGDEFVVILEGIDLENASSRMKELSEAVQTENETKEKDMDKISIAGGIALYDSRIDTQFSDVFQRADAAMYKNKREMKAVLDYVI